MATLAQDAPMYNPIGALLFIAYVLSALYLTILIINDLAKAYQSRLATDEEKPKTKIGKSLQGFIALAALSFSTLSYHMLNYLVVSYKAWVCLGHKIEECLYIYGTGSLAQPYSKTLRKQSAALVQDSGGPSKHYLYQWHGAHS